MDEEQRQEERDLIDFEWGSEEDRKEIETAFDNEPDDVFEAVRKIGWEDVSNYEDTRPRELMENVERLMNLGAKFHERGIKNVKMVDFAMTIWIKIPGEGHDGSKENQRVIDERFQ